jgi:hypothetical protein
LRARHFSPVLMASACLTACASFNSMPDPVLTVRATNAMMEPYAVTKALQDIETAPDKKAYRNKVIAAYLAAADARYLSFLQQLSRQTKGSNFGLDVAALGLSSIAAIAKGAANELSTGAAIATGTRGSLNKEVYFDKALPALITSMEARRITVRGEIEQRMRDEESDAYTLEQGFADIVRYQMATTLDGAIQEITKSAGEQEAAAQELYKDAVDACDPAEGLAAKWGTVNRAMAKPASQGGPTAERLKAVAVMLGAAEMETSLDQRNAIMDALERACSVEKADATLALLQTQEG